MLNKSKSVLFISNCQSLIYQKAFSLLIADDIFFEVITTNDVKNYNERIANNEFDTIIGPSSILNDAKFSSLVEGLGTEVLILEPFLLNSFHPDICYAKDINGNLLRTKMGDYNSIIVLSGFLLGLSVDEVVKLFNGELFQRFGFYDLWSEDIKRLQEKNSLKLNWAYLLRDESRSGGFMFTFNHPKSSILFEISKQILKYLGVGYHDLSSNCIPSYLANGPVWPVYPDIAERFTMKGDLFFKPADSWSVFNLKTFVETSFEEYGKLEIKENSLTVLGCGNRFEQVMAVLKGKL